MKNFNDFLASLNEETIAEIMSDANLKTESIRSSMDKNHPAYQGNQIGAVAFTIALEILGLYHKWLFEETEMN